MASFLLLEVSPGCSQKEKTLSEIRKLFDAGEYRETIAQCRHALRRDYREGELYYYYGLALVHLGRDYEALRQLDLAVEADPALARTTAEALFESGKTAHGKGDIQRAMQRVKAAVTYYPAIELGAYRFVAAEACYEEKEFEKAANLFDRAIEEFPDTVVIEKALYNLAISNAMIGLEGRARESLERLLDEFPHGEFAKEAEWKLANLLYEKSVQELSHGNFERAIEIAGELLALTKNNALIQKSRFLRGEAYEGLGDFKSAYEEYRAIIRQDRGASGRIIERAREKIAVLREAGLF